MAGKKTAEKPLTLSQLVGFFERAVEPRFERLETQMTEFRNETNTRFDDLYKKYSDLHQEYLILNVQMNRLTEGKASKVEVQELRTRVDKLQQDVEELEQHIL